MDVNEAVRRVESFEARGMIELRLGHPVTAEEFAFSQDLIKAVIKLLKSAPTPEAE